MTRPESRDVLEAMTKEPLTRSANDFVGDSLSIRQARKVLRAALEAAGIKGSTIANNEQNRLNTAMHHLLDAAYGGGDDG